MYCPRTLQLNDNNKGLFHLLSFEIACVDSVSKSNEMTHVLILVQLGAFLSTPSHSHFFTTLYIRERQGHIIMFVIAFWLNIAILFCQYLESFTLEFTPFCNAVDNYWKTRPLISFEKYQLTRRSMGLSNALTLLVYQYI